MDDILIDISSMKSKASQLQALSKRVYSVAEKMVVIQAQLSAVWKDEGFAKYDSDFTSGIGNILALQATLDSMVEVCNAVCDEYQAADNKILSQI